jgi:acyl-CoA thioester hydrolase
VKYYDYEYRVRYAETDKMGISYHANYLVWFEAARTEYFRVLGLPYTDCEKKGLFLPVVEVYAKYYSPCTYDDLIIVRTSVSDMGGTTLRFEYQVLHKETSRRIVTGHSLHAFVDARMKPARAPEEVRGAITLHSLLHKPAR